MTRKHLTGLLLAASIMTAGTIAVVHAQAGVADPAAEEAHDHEHTPKTVHAGDDSAFELDDKDAYPDADGFKSMQDRISYAIGRSDGQQIPRSQPDLDTKTYGEGIKKGLQEEKEDFALGYAQGFEITRRVLAQRGDDDEVNMEAFIAGITAALKAEDEDYALGFTQGYQITQQLLAQRGEEDKVDLDTFVPGIAEALKEEDEGRAIGYLIGNSYREAELGVDAESYLAGVAESIAAAKQAIEPPAGEGEGEKPEPEKVELRLTQAQVDETLNAFNVILTEKQKQESIDEGKAYIDGLKEEDGWKKTESGIAIKVIKEGEGDSPDANDVVTMNYEGSLLDGTVFDSSYRNGQPLVYPANQLITGWTEVLQMMKPGAHYEVVIPYELAYGEQGSRSIPPYATLKFKMEMIGFEPVENEPEPDQAPAAPGE